MATVSAHAPGRVELLGNHTDYNEGVVLAAAIDRGITVRGAARDDGRIILTSSLTTETVDVPLTEIAPRPQQRWANYPLGVVQQFQKRGDRVSGFELQITGNVPAGAGLSSSAALEVATAGFLMKLHNIRIEPIEVAKLCQRAENEFVGVRSGLLDQAASVFGRADHLVYLDFKNGDVQTIPFPAGYALVIVESGAKHSLLQSQYNARREECAAAAKALGVSSLREITPAALAAARSALDDVLYRRAAHIVGENERVIRAVAALQRGDAAAVGELMNASHESSRVNFENSTPQLDELVSIARALPGVLGSRLTGGGFGGGTVTLAHAADARAVVEQMRFRYSQQSGHDVAGFVCRIADGAAVGWLNR